MPAIDLANPTSMPSTAVVEVYMGRQIWADGAQRLGHLTFDVGLDGKIIGHINREQVLRVNLPKGKHKITSYTHTIWGPKFPRSVDVEITAGDHRYFAINQYQRANPNRMKVGLLFGAVGSLAQGIADSSAARPAKEPGIYLEEETSSFLDTSQLQPTDLRNDKANQGRE